MGWCRTLALIPPFTEPNTAEQSIIVVIEYHSPRDSVSTMIWSRDEPVKCQKIYVCVTEMLKKCCGPRTVDVAMEWTVLDLSTAVLSFLRSTQIRRFRAVKGCVRMWQETPVSVRTVEIMRASECARTRTFQTNIQKNGGGTLPHRENPSLYLAPWYLNCSSFFFRPSDAPVEICDYKLL